MKLHMRVRCWAAFLSLVRNTLGFAVCFLLTAPVMNAIAWSALIVRSAAHGDYTLLNPGSVFFLFIFGEAVTYSDEPQVFLVAAAVFLGARWLLKRTPHAQNSN